jgi:hypothetical protein
VCSSAPRGLQAVDCLGVEHVFQFTRMRVRPGSLPKKRRKIAATMDDPFYLDELTGEPFPYAEENDIRVNHGNSRVSPDFRSRL